MEEIAMSIDKKVALSLDSLPADVFDVVDGAQLVESLTAGHGMTELGASCSPAECYTSCTCYQYPSPTCYSV
jgi:hypothetical protein